MLRGWEQETEGNMLCSYRIRDTAGEITWENQHDTAFWFFFFFFFCNELIQRLCDLLCNRSADIRKEPQPKSHLFIHISYTLAYRFPKCNLPLLSLYNQQIRLLNKIINTSVHKSVFIKRRKTHSLLTHSNGFSSLTSDYSHLVRLWKNIQEQGIFYPPYLLLTFELKIANLKCFI